MFVDYYKLVDRKQAISDYVNKNKDKYKSNILDFGIASVRNGGYVSCFRKGGYYICCNIKVELVWHYCFYANELEENLYVDFDAFDVYRNLIEQDVLYFNGEYFDFIRDFHRAIINMNSFLFCITCNYRKLITKAEKEKRSISRKKAIKILIDFLKLKIKYKI